MQSSSVLKAGIEIETIQTINILPPNKNKFLSDELLTAFHPVVKLPLARWAQQVLDLLQPNTGTSPDYNTISVCFNQAALLEFNFGSTERAFKLCYAHLEWLAEIISRTGRLELAVQAFDPWLNLGRLERLTGNYAASLQRFELLSKVSVQPETALGPFTLTSAYWQAIINDRPEVEAFVTRAGLTDTLKTLLKSKQYQTTLELIEQTLSSNPDQNLYSMLLEAKFISLCRLERNTEALELIERYNLEAILKTGTTTKISSLLNFSFGLHQLEALATSHNLPGARNLAQELARRGQLFHFEKEPRLFKITLVLRLAKLLEALNLAELALPIVQQGFEATLAMQDELLEVEFLKLLVFLDIGATETLKSHSQWQQRLEQLAQTTCYADLRRRLLPDVALLKTNNYRAECAAILDDLYEVLTDQTV